LQESRCPTLGEVKTAFEEKGYTLLSTQYVNNRDSLQFLCPRGHKWQMSWDKFKSGIGCGACYRESAPKTTIELVQEYLLKEGYKLLPKEGDIDSKDQLQALCPNGELHSFCWNNFQQGHRCPCSKCISYQSKKEKEIFAFFKDRGFNVASGDRVVLNGMELDIYFPDHKIAIEYCGLYWHSEHHKPASYHRNKMNRCQAKGIRLFTIFEDEWINKSEVCLSRIENALKTGLKRIFARKCEIKIISKMEAKNFLYRTHLQGYVGCKVACGLFYDQKLIQVMTLGSLSRAHAAKGKKVLEFKRLSNEPGMVIVGGASKLFKYAVNYARSNGYDSIKSYCDLRWGTGNLYQKLGFILENDSKYTPHYTDGIRRYRNQGLASSKKEGSNESQKANKRGLYKIYDCGHQTWSFTI
jgi:hypothetical protein